MSGLPDFNRFWFWNALVLASVFAVAAVILTSCQTEQQAEADSLPCCHCYVDQDCKKWYRPATQCKLNDIASPKEETECHFGEPKPDRASNKPGCTQRADADGYTPCDGRCVEPEDGSSCGGISPEQLRRALNLWGRAYIRAAATGGGMPVDSIIVRARNLDIPEFCWQQLSRSATGFATLAWGPEAIHHPEESHVDHEHEVQDLSDDTCRLEAARTIFDVLTERIANPEYPLDQVRQISESCPDGLPFSDPCVGEGAFECVQSSIADAAVFLRTPRQEE